MNSFGILLSIGVEELFNYPIKDIVIIIGSVVALIEAIDALKKKARAKKQEDYEEMSDEIDHKNKVNNDHDRVIVAEKQILALTRCVKEILKTDIMDAHDKFMSRKPFPYITKYERLIHITMYDAYAALDADPVIDGFHKELLELTVYDDDTPPSSSDAGDI